MHRMFMYVDSLRKKLYIHCSVLVASRHGFEQDFTVELNLL